MKKLTILAALLAASLAHATPPDKTPTTKAPKTVTSSATSAPSSASATATAPVSVTASPSASAGAGSAAVKVDSAPTAYAPSLAASGPCMGSSSAGGGNGAVALSFGSTWSDGDCNARADALTLWALGQQRAAIARLCQRPDTARALADAGVACPGADRRASEAPAASTTANLSDDPLIRARQLRANGGN